MTARCKKCNKCNPFRNQRGNRLSNHKCDCGGDLEMVGGMHSIAGIHPFDGKTHESGFYIGPYYYAHKNRKGEYFIYHEGFFHRIYNPNIPK